MKILTNRFHMEQNYKIVKVGDQKLGRGLSALLGEHKPKASLFNLDADDKIHNIDLELIEAGTFQPRNIFDENDLNELAESIKEHGVLQPIILRKKTDNKFEIIAGERRFRASKIAKLKEIPAIIKKFSDHTALEVAIIENIQRADLAVTEEAMGYKKLIEKFSYTHEAIAKKVGKSRSHINNLLRILNLPVKVRAFLENNQISMGHARAIINAENPEKIANEIIEKNLNVRDTEEMVRDEKIEKAKRTPVMIRTESKIRYINSQHLNDLENEISQLVDLDCKISYNGLKGSGKITLKFDEIEQIKKLIKNFK